MASSPPSCRGGSNILTMGKRVTVHIVDDLDGAILDEYETVRWALDGKNYDFDTSAKNAEKFRTVLAKYRAASRKARGTTARSRTSPPAEQTQAIRDWAGSNGYQVGTRGRISSTVLDAFNATHRAAT